MHWADVLAATVARNPSPHVFATAITPSGPIHLGNLREVLTTDAVFRATKDLGADAELIYIGDSFDPLRKVYPFLKEAGYKEHVGKPLSEVPCPDADGMPARCHESYAHHFLEPFLQALEELGVTPRVLLAHEMYERGDYLEATRVALEATPAIRDILVRVAKREGKIPENYIPYNVQCQECRRLNGPVVELYEYPYIEYTCKVCGFSGRKDVRTPGGGKLPWRVDWPARWWFLGVTFEAMGKDHAAAGSSWDTGIEIARKVYGREPPVRTVYEFIQLKGVGAMHSSTGTAIAATEMLRMTPPEVLRFLIMRPQPERHIDFDPGDGVANLVDEYDRWDGTLFGAGARTSDMEELERVIELSEPEHPMKRGHTHPGIGWENLSTLWQNYQHTKDPVNHLMEIVQTRQNIALEVRDRQWLQSRIQHVAYWLETYAPMKRVFTLYREEPPPGLDDLIDQDHKAYAKFLAARYEKLRNNWEPKLLHDAVYEVSAETGLAAKKGFETVYEAFSGQETGPRLGFFLGTLDPDFVIKRLRHVAGQDIQEDR